MGVAKRGIRFRLPFGKLFCHLVLIVIMQRLGLKMLVYPRKLVPLPNVLAVAASHKRGTQHIVAKLAGRMEMGSMDCGVRRYACRRKPSRKILSVLRNLRSQT